MCPYPEENLIGPVSEHLNEAHENQYIVYNLSEHKYDYSCFRNSVSEFLLFSGDGVFVSGAPVSAAILHVHDMSLHEIVARHRSSQRDSAALPGH